MKKNFLRITRHPHTPAHVDAIASALGCAAHDLHVVTKDVGTYGANPRTTVMEPMAAMAVQAGVQWDGVEVTGPAHVLEALTDLEVPLYRAVMARGPDSRILIQRDAEGNPVRGPDGRDVLVIESYTRA